MKTSRFLLPLLTVFTIDAALFAEDQDRGADESSRLMERATKAKQEGRFDEARELHEQLERKRDREAQERNRKKEQPDPAKDERFARMKREIEELRRAGRKEEAEARMNEMRKDWEREKGGRGKGMEPEGPAKIRHVMEAVNHLRAAGMKDLAQRLEHEAMQMREGFERRQREEGKKQEGDSAARASREVNDLREQVQRMEREMAKLREELKDRRSEGADVQ